MADQLYGDSGDRYHMDLRSNTVEYMRRNREDFEPFFDPEYEGVTFDRHLDLLEEDGTFAGKCDTVYCRAFGLCPRKHLHCPFLPITSKPHLFMPRGKVTEVARSASE